MRGMLRMILVNDSVRRLLRGTATGLLGVLLMSCAAVPKADQRPSPAGPLPGGRVEIPFELRDGFISLRVTMPDGEHWAMLETGAFSVIVSQASADKMKLPVREGGTGSYDASGRRIDGVTAVIPSLRVGAVEFRDVSVFSTDISRIVDRQEHPAEIILNRTLFQGYLLTIDYPGRKLVLENGALPPANGRDIISVQRTLSREWLVPLTVDGKEIWAVLDTGATLGFICPDWCAKLFKESTKTVKTGSAVFWGGQGDVRTARVEGDMVLAGVTIHRPALAVVGSAEPVLGAELLQYFRITLDQANSLARFQCVSGSADLPGPLVPGLAISMIGSRVTEIDPSSNARSAGIEIGDELVAINGWTRAAGVGKKPKVDCLDRSVRLKLRRDGREYETDLHLIPLLK